MSSMTPLPAKWTKTRFITRAKAAGPESPQFSDGDNWGEDNRDCLEILTENIVPHCNLFCYGQVESPYGSGEFIRELQDVREQFDNVVLSEIENKEAIYDSIKLFLGKGK